MMRLLALAVTVTVTSPLLTADGGLRASTDSGAIAYSAKPAPRMAVNRPSGSSYATSGRVISGDRRCRSRMGPVRGTVTHVAAAVPLPASTTSRTRCGVVMT
jgi:hypothetical protein